MDHSKEEEFQLIREILGGEVENFKILVDRYSSMVYHVVRGFVRDEEDMDELAQQIFVKSYERLDSFKMESKFSSWLYMIAKNHCRDYVNNIRRGNRRFSEMEDHVIERSFPESVSPEELMEQAEREDLLDEALESLSQEYSQPFLYKYRDGMSYSAMSKRMEVSESALKVRVHRARIKLKEYMENKMQ